MENKFTSVKNPLTVIAFFAGTAEICGTVVLPHIAAANQAVYIWFLMLFPFLLVVIFFLTLNFNHRVLYAPSDFRDEDNFVNILKKSTAKEVKEYKEREAALNPFVQTESPDPLTLHTSELIPGESELATAPDAALSSPTAAENILAAAEISRLPLNIATSKSQRDALDLISKQIEDRRKLDMRIAEIAALEALENELDISIDREMKIEIGSTSVHFDGVARRGSKLTAIEVKFLPSRRFGSINVMMWHDLRRKLEALYQSLSDDQRKDFSFILVVVNDNDSNQIETIVSRRLSGLPFPTATKIYDFDTLIASQTSAI